MNETIKTCSHGHHEHNGSCDHLHNHGGNLADLMASIPTEQQFFMAADVFSMLCDSTRLRILWQSMPGSLLTLSGIPVTTT